MPTTKIAALLPSLTAPLHALRDAVAAYESAPSVDMWRAVVTTACATNLDLSISDEETDQISRAVEADDTALGYRMTDTLWPTVAEIEDEHRDLVDLLKEAAAEYRRMRQRWPKG